MNETNQTPKTQKRFGEAASLKKTAVTFGVSENSAISEG